MNDTQIINKGKYYKEITPKHNLLDLRLKEVWKYRDLIWLFTKRSFTVTYKQTILGPAWIFINPIFTSIIYTFVFGNIAGMSTDGIPQLLFYLTGTALWTLFSTCLTNNANTFTGNAYIFGKVYFPRLTTPLSNVLSDIIRFAIQMITAIICLIYYVAVGEVQPNWGAWVVIPLVVIQLSFMGMGLGIIVSSMTTKYRDLNVLIGFAVSLLMYATPVVYPISQLGDGMLSKIIKCNPVTAPMELFKYAFLGQGYINLVTIITSWVFTIVVLVFGIMIFNKVEKTFMDTV